MNYISDLALDLGQFELDYELESGTELIARVPAKLARKHLPVLQMKQERLKACDKFTGARQSFRERIAS